AAPAAPARPPGHPPAPPPHTDPSPPQGPVHDDRPTAPGTQIDHHDVFQAPGRPDPYLRPSRGVGVVLHDHGYTQAHRQCVPQGFVTPGQVKIGRAHV